MTPDFWLPDLTDEKKNGWAFYLHYTKDAADGMVGVCHKTGEIGHLFVTEAARGRGYGAKMLDFARKKAAGARPPDDGGLKHEHPRHRAVQADGLAADGHSAAPLRPRRGRHLCSGIL